jgi:hypothetical protein
MKRACLGRGVDLEEELAKAGLLEWVASYAANRDLAGHAAYPGNLSTEDEVMIKDVRIGTAEPLPWELLFSWWI